MIHSSNYKPRVLPVLGDLQDVEIDRVQDLTSSLTLNRTKIEEVGRDGIVDWRVGIPTCTVSVRQFEYGSLEFFRKIANKGDTVSQVNWTDMKSSKFDIVGYTTDDNGTFLGSIWYPNLRVAGFGFNIGDPQATVERNFSFVGDDEIALQNNNKYLIRGRYVIASTANNQTVTISNPTPTADPDNSGRFLFKVVKVSGGTATELTHGTQWSYNGAGTLTINGSSTAGDVIWVWYSGATQGGQTIFSNNDTDIAAAGGDSCDIFLINSNRVTRLQSVSVDITWDRRDIFEIGNTDTVAQGARDISTRVTLGRLLESYTIEEFLRGVQGQSFGKLDPKRYLDNFALVIKVYSDNTKSTFKLGYKWTDLAPSGRDAGTPVNDYVSAGTTLEGLTGFVTNVNATLVL